MHALNQGGILIRIYDTSLLTISILQKHNKFDYLPFIELMAATGIAN